MPTTCLLQQNVIIKEFQNRLVARCVKCWFINITRLVRTDIHSVCMYVLNKDDKIPHNHTHTHALYLRTKDPYIYRVGGDTNLLHIGTVLLFFFFFRYLVMVG